MAAPMMSNGHSVIVFAPAETHHQTARTLPTSRKRLCTLLTNLRALRVQRARPRQCDVQGSESAPIYQPDLVSQT